MKIYTRQGDQGQTGLIGGKRIAKTDSLIEAYGAVDELSASLGVVRSALDEQGHRMTADLENIQHHLHTLCAELAGLQVSRENPRLEERHIQWLEKQCDAFQSELPELTYFILPGGIRPASLLHQSRTICRRAERRIFQAANQYPVSEIDGKYVNRLSDLLYLMARYLNDEADYREIRTDYDSGNIG